MADSRKTVNCRVGFSPPILAKFSILNSKFLLLLCTCAVVFFLIAAPAQAKYGGGTGGPNDPYLIYTANQMNEIGLNEEDWDKHFLLCADIDLAGFTGTSFNIIGTGWDNAFTGVFDGNGHTISNFTYSSTGTDYVGLFRWVSGVIKDMGLIAPDVDAGTGWNVGSLVGGNHGTVTGCYVEGGSVSGNYSVGGLVGTNGGTITNCYSEGDISGETQVGGLVGNNYGTIANCYSTGSVEGDSSVGGLVGRNSGEVIGSFWDIETSGQTTSAGGTGNTTAEMRTASTFLNWGVCEGVWTIDEGVDYPRLAWQQLPGVPIIGTFPLQGDGDFKSPYLLHTPEELNVIGLLPCLWYKHFKVMADIDLSHYTGTEFNIIPYFTGIFDGNGHTISNFTYTSTDGIGAGLFGYVDDPNAVIKDLGLINPDVDAGTGGFVGSLVGYLKEGTITGCYVEGGSVAGDGFVGGLVGDNGGTITECCATATGSGKDYVGGLVGYNRGTITNCYAEGSVTGTTEVGGLVGCNQGTITNCYSAGSVSGYRYIGGLVGSNGDTITNCYATGSVTGVSSVGGLVGENWETITNCYSTASVSGTYYIGGLVGYNCHTISNCYSTGSVSGTWHVGGLVGLNESGPISGSFWDIETIGQETSAGGTGKTTAEMQMQVTFMDAGWDFVGERINGSEDIWMMTCEGMSYPKLSWWQPVPGDYFCPDGVDMIDMEHLALHWLDTGCDETNDYCDWAEISNDSTIDFTDFAILTSKWLRGF